MLYLKTTTLVKIASWLTILEKIPEEKKERIKRKRESEKERKWVAEEEGEGEIASLFSLLKKRNGTHSRKIKRPSNIFQRVSKQKGCCKNTLHCSTDTNEYNGSLQIKTLTHENKKGRSEQKNVHFNWHCKTEKDAAYKNTERKKKKRVRNKRRNNKKKKKHHHSYTNTHQSPIDPLRWSIRILRATR